MLFQEILKILVGSVDAALFVDFQYLLFLADPETDFTGQINVPGGNEPGIEQSVKGAFTDHETILIGDTNVMRRLALPNEWRNDIINVTKLIF